MKKILFLFIVASAFSAKAQVFWQATPTGFAATSRAVEQISYGVNNANSAWITVFDGPTPANNLQEFGLSTDAGLTWTTGNIGLGNPAFGIGCISAVNESVCFASVWPSQAGGPGGGIWKTIDAGASWVRQPTAAYDDAVSFANIVHFVNANDGFTMGDPVGGFFEIYTTSNGGTNRTRMPNSPSIAALSGEFGTTRNIYANGNDIWFGTNAGRLFHSTDKGLTWSGAPSPIANTNNGTFAFINSTNGLFTDDGLNMWTTIDGGATWQEAVPNGTLRSGGMCHVPGTTNAYVITGPDESNNFGSSFTLDGGLNWENVNLLGDEFNVNVTSRAQFTSPTNGLAPGSNSTTDLGIFKYIGTQLNPLATSQFASSIFSISPNPTTGLVNLKGTNINQVAVTDILGKVVLNNNYSSLSDVTLNMSDLNSGVYFVKVTNNEGTSSTSKVVKQ